MRLLVFLCPSDNYNLSMGLNLLFVVCAGF
jgi:hypothetical protein